MRVVMTRRIGYSVLLLMVLVVVLYELSAAINQPGETRNVDDATLNKIFTTPGEPVLLSEIKFKDGEGQNLTLDDFKGKYVLLNIWATWCLPCREEMPALDHLQEKMGGADFEVIPISIDGYSPKGISLVKEFYLDFKLEHLKIYLDSSGNSTSVLNIIGLPTTLLIDPEGREIGRKIGPAEWDSAEVVKEIQGYIRIEKAGAG